MDRRILDILVCPICKGPLKLDKTHANTEVQGELICQPDRLAFPIRDGIPVMLVDSARAIEAT